VKEESCREGRSELIEDFEPSSYVSMSSFKLKRYSSKRKRFTLRDLNRARNGILIEYEKEKE